jgi:tRNA (cmo5U34)-methyltransferase
MPDRQTSTESETRPANVPAHLYAQTVIGVNIGYALNFTLASCFLRALHQPQLDLLVIGAGGGKEIEQFLPDNPGWRLTGVDPSSPMLDVAQETALHLGVQDRATLVQGTVDDLSPGGRFDAATCMYVLHFLPTDAKRTLLRGIAARLKPHAPLFLVTGVRGEGSELGDDLEAAWQQHGELFGLPAVQMAGIIRQITEQASSATSPTADGYVEMLRDAGFPHVAPVHSVACGHHGSLVAWIARTAAV